MNQFIYYFLILILLKKFSKIQTIKSNYSLEVIGLLKIPVFLFSVIFFLGFIK